MYHFDFFLLLAPDRAYSAKELGACLHPSELISNLAPGRAYHAIYVLFLFSFPYLRLPCNAFALLSVTVPCDRARLRLLWFLDCLVYL